MKNLKLKAVIFDMDGVITDTMPYHFRAWRKIFQDHGINVSKFDVYCREGQKGTESIKEIFAYFDVSITTSQAKKIITEKEALYKTIARQRFIPGTRTLIKRLHHSGIKLALVTGTARHEVKVTLPHELLNCFDIVVTGTDVQNGKPHPEPYLKAIKGLKISASDALVIENAPFGIQSAQAAGLKCWAVSTSLPRKYLKSANKIFIDIKTLHKELARLTNEK